MNKKIIGWDVGGANLKAALLDGNGELQQVLQVPCALWRGLSELEAAIDMVLKELAFKPAMHAVTMTGELVDLFANRQTGVRSISQVMDEKLTGSKWFYTGRFDVDASPAGVSGFVALDAVDQHWRHIASANWLASASYTGLQLQRLQKYQHGLLIDIGSTTSDFVLLENNQPACLAYTDASRMQTEELIYTGVVRTPLMAVAQKIRFENSITSVAAEYFATTADVYRLTGDLLAANDIVDTADGQEKTPVASARRIARMIGHDVEDAAMPMWLALAQEFKLQQLIRLKEAAVSHISRIKTSNQTSKIVIVGAGVGCFLAREIAALMNMQYIDIAELIEKPSGNTSEVLPDTLIDIAHWAGICLPAVAVAKLLHNNLN